MAAPRRLQVQAKKRPSPFHVPARFCKTHCGLQWDEDEDEDEENWALELRTCSCSCMHALRIATRQQVLELLDVTRFDACRFVACAAGAVPGWYLWGPDCGTLSRANRIGARIAIALKSRHKKGRDRHRDPQQGRIKFLAWNCVFDRG